MTTHYQVLKIGQGATTSEIRTAYHAQARLWHPDRFTIADAGSREAETKMRSINEAWRVLQDFDLRSTYDAQQNNVRVEPTRKVHTSTVDARLLDPEVLRKRSLQREQVVDDKSQLIVKLAPFLALLFLLGLVFVYTGYASRPDDGRTPQTVPGPDVPFAPGSCIRVLSEGLVEVPDCSGAFQGRLVAVRMPDGVCTDSTISEVVYKDVVLCLE